MAGERETDVLEAREEFEGMEEGEEGKKKERDDAGEREAKSRAAARWRKGNGNVSGKERDTGCWRAGCNALGAERCGNARLGVQGLLQWMRLYSVVRVRLWSTDTTAQPSFDAVSARFLFPFFFFYSSISLSRARLDCPCYFRILEWPGRCVVAGGAWR